MKRTIGGLPLPPSLRVTLVAMSAIEAPIEALLAYAEAKRVVVHEAVSVKHSPEEGFGLFTDKPLEKGELVIRLPLSSTLSLAKDLPPSLAPLLSSLEPRLALAVLLCLTRGIEDWIANWPVQPQGSWGLCHTPGWENLVSWNRELAHRHAESTASVHEAFHTTIRPFLTATDDLGDINYQRYLWAVSMVDSRAARVHLYGEERLVLMPLVDLLNHRSEPSCSLAFEPMLGDSGELVVRLKHTVDADEQLTISYGDKANDELIAQYGFALLHAPHECAVVLLPLVGDSSLVMQKASLLPPGTTFVNDAGEIRACVSFGWCLTSSAETDSLALNAPQLTPEVWLVLRIAGATDMMEVFEALSCAGDKDCSTRSGWQSLLQACEEQLASISKASETNGSPGTSSGETPMHASTISATAAHARTELLNATIRAANTALHAEHCR